MGKSKEIEKILDNLTELSVFGKYLEIAKCIPLTNHELDYLAVEEALIKEGTKFTSECLAFLHSCDSKWYYYFCKYTTNNSKLQPIKEKIQLDILEGNDNLKKFKNRDFAKVNQELQERGIRLKDIDVLIDELNHEKKLINDRILELIDMKTVKPTFIELFIPDDIPVLVNLHCKILNVDKSLLWEALPLNKSTWNNHEILKNFLNQYWNLKEEEKDKYDTPQLLRALTFKQIRRFSFSMDGNKLIVHSKVKDVNLEVSLFLTDIMKKD